MSCQKEQPERLKQRALHIPATRLFAMKRLILIFLLMAATAQAVHVDSVSVAPEIWLGNSLNITATCSNGTIDRAYVNISGQGIVLPSFNMNGASGEYTLGVSGSYFGRKGNYIANVICEAGSEAANKTEIFQISELTASIKPVQLSYTGDGMQIVFVPKKNDVIINNPSDIAFTVLFDNEPRLINSFYYDAERGGWVITVEAPSPKTYTLTVTGTHQGMAVSASQPVTIKPQLEFAIVGANKYSVKNGDNLSLDVKAVRRDAMINLDNLAVYVNGVAAQIYSTTQGGSTYTVKAAMPSLSPGRYELRAEITNNGTLYMAYMNVSYVAVLSGKLTEKNMQLRLLKSGSEVYRINSLSDGSYSSDIIPDTYDASLEFTDATITLENANINSLDNPLDYYYNSVPVDGFEVSRIYHIKIPWGFSRATVKLRYDPSLLTGGDVSVFKCSTWNAAANRCSSIWTKILPEINTDQKLVTFTVSSFSSFIIGNEESLKVSLNTDKKKYAKRDLISLRGAVMASNDAVNNATVRIKIEGTYVDHTVYSNQNGAFSLDFLGPENENNYTMTVTATKTPYLSYSGTNNIEIVNMPSISVVFPGAVQVKKNNSTEEDIFIVNTGQAKITGLRVDTDLDENYYKVGEVPDTLEVKQELHIPIKFFGDGDPRTESANLRIAANELSEEKTFGFTVLEDTPAAQAVTGFAFSMPAIGAEVYVVIIFAAAAFSTAFLAKRYRKSLHRPAIHRENYHMHREPEEIHDTRRHSNDVSAYLSDVKNYLRRKS